MLGPPPAGAEQKAAQRLQLLPGRPAGRQEEAGALEWLPAATTAGEGLGFLP